MKKNWSCEKCFSLSKLNEVKIAAVSNNNCTIIWCRGVNVTKTNEKYRAGYSPLGIMIGRSEVFKDAIIMISRGRFDGEVTVPKQFYVHMILVQNDGW